jgi:hypothetical protein
MEGIAKLQIEPALRSPNFDRESKFCKSLYGKFIFSYDGRDGGVFFACGAQFLHGAFF